jgi:hypothetical protein
MVELLLPSQLFAAEYYLVPFWCKRYSVGTHRFLVMLDNSGVSRSTATLPALLGVSYWETQFI